MKNQEDPQIQAARDKVHVKKCLNPFKRNLNILFVCCILCSLILMTMRHSAKSTSKNDLTVDHSVNFTDKLRENLASLRALNRNALHAASRSHHYFQDQSQQKSSLKLRQHAPMTLYNMDSSDYQQAQEQRLQRKQHVGTAKRIESGEVIHATLETAINSDLPGLVRAIITSPVYTNDQRIAIPSGSHVLGQYQSTVLEGQKRLGIIWNLILLPDGQKIKLYTSSTDTLGRTGQQANAVNHHFLESFGQSSMLSAIGASLPTNSTHTNDSTVTAVNDISSAFKSNANQLLTTHQIHQPTLSIRQGEKIQLLVNKDIVL